MALPILAFAVKAGINLSWQTIASVVAGGGISAIAQKGLYEKGRYDGIKEGKIEQAKIDELKFRQQAEIFFEQKKTYDTAKEEYDEILEYYEEYIDWLQKKHSITEEDQKEFDQLLKEYAILNLLKKKPVIYTNSIEEFDFKMSIEDVFGIKDVGTVVCGKVEYGELSVNENATIQKSNGESLDIIVSGIEIKRKLFDKVSCGDEAGILIKNFNKNDVIKGDCLVKYRNK